MAKQKSQDEAARANGADVDVASNTANADADQDAGAPQLVKGRVLAHCALGKPNDVIDIEVALAATMTDLVDTNAEAVAYAMSINKE